MPGYSLADRVAAQEAVARRYPKEAVLRDNRPVQLRAMTAGDRDAMLEFARALPPNDLLFLRTNIAEPPVVNEWIANIAVGRTFTIMATANDEIIGFVSLHYNQADWTRHLGEVLIITSDAYRGVGLGRLLAVEIYAAADALELRKLSAQMALDQPGARATFERLGFRPEALLTDFAIDAEGTTRDLLVMTYDLAGLTDSAS
jgi:RimJ/RimL family protein N-acetyltransferase